MKITLSRSLLLIAFSIIATGITHAQDNLLVSERYPEMKYNRVVGGVYFNDYLQIKGNAFLTEDWNHGDVLLNDGYTIKNINFKLDAYTHRLLVYQEYLKRIVILEKRLIQSFTIYENNKERRFILADFNDTRANAENGSFLEVLLEDHISFYKFYSRDVVPLRASEGILLDEFTNELDYYIYENEKYSRVRVSKSTLFNRYPQFKNQMKQHIRKQKLRVKKEEDFIAALAYLSQLVELMNADTKE